MASPTFQIDEDYRGSEMGPKKRGPWFGCLIGCLIVLALGVVLAVVAGVWISKNWKGLAASGMSMGIKQEIDRSDLSAEEKAQVKVQIDRFADTLGDPDTSTEEAAQLMQMFAQEFMEAPLVGTIMLSASEQEQIDTSGLSDEEKADARTALRRLMRGMLDRNIASSDADAAAQQIAVRQPNNRWQLKKSVSDEELRAFTDKAKKAADDANVPEQPGPIDPSEEVKRAVDAALSWNAPKESESGEPIDVPPIDAPQDDQ
jgi:hypothetical protein